MRRLALLALFASTAPALAATPTNGASEGRLKVGLVIVDTRGGIATAATPGAGAQQRMAPRVTRESENGVAYTLIYY